MRLTPFDLAGISPLIAATDMRLVFHRSANFEKAQPLEIAANIALFLHTLDADGAVDRRTVSQFDANGGVALSE